MLQHAGDGVRLINSDLAVLETPENRTDLDCRVSSAKPELGFDLRFHASYQARIPLKELAGQDRLRVLIRITPADRREIPAHLTDRVTIPPLDEEAKGEVMVPGAFTIGSGRYRVDWMMRDSRDRICSAHWDLEAEPPNDLSTPLTLAPNTIAELPTDVFRQPPPVERVAAGQALHVKILVNLSPSDPRESSFKPWDAEAIASILRNVTSERRFGSFSLVAFNIQEERVIYQTENVPQIDFPALGEAMTGVRLGTVEFRNLADENSATRFLTTMLVEQLGPQNPEPDAIIMVGPKLMLDQDLPQELLRRAGATNSPVFYLNYNSNPRRNPWRDAIGKALRVYKGLEYSITLPLDLGNALADMMSRLRKPR